MPNAVPWQEGRHITATAVTDNILNGTLGAGLVVEHRTGSTMRTPLVGIAAANSATVAGVALEDAIPVANAAAMQTGTNGYGQSITDMSVQTPFLRVITDGLVNVTYSFTATVRQPLKAAANGQVALWVSGTDAPNLLIGYAAEAVASGAVGGMKIKV